MQQMSLEELKHVLFHAFRDHLTMKDIENIIVTEEESLKENSGNCQTEFQGGKLQRKQFHINWRIMQQLFTDTGNFAKLQWGDA